MGKNKVQCEFQKGFSWQDLYQWFGSEQHCWRALYQPKFPQGSLCQTCQNTTNYRIQRRQCLQCTSCKRQYSRRAGAMLAFSKVSLKIWFRFMALYLITQSGAIFIKASHH